MGNRLPGRRVEQDVRATLGAEDDAGPGTGDAAKDFEPFFTAAWPGAVRLAALLTQDRGAAEELAQDAFTRVFRTWERVENPDAYLRTSVVNACHNWRRRAGVREAKLPLLVSASHVDLDTDELADAVAQLPFRQRAVIVLRYYGGLSETEIGKALGCRNGTVKSLSSRALAHLERVVER